MFCCKHPPSWKMIKYSVVYLITDFVSPCRALFSFYPAGENFFSLAVFTSQHPGSENKYLLTESAASRKLFLQEKYFTMVFYCVRTFLYFSSNIIQRFSQDISKSWNKVTEVSTKCFYFLEFPWESFKRSQQFLNLLSAVNLMILSFLAPENRYYAEHLHRLPL